MASPEIKSATVAVQIAQLRSRGVLIEDPDMARRWLTFVNYARMSDYSYPFRNRDTREYTPGTKFHDIVALSEFDRSLRLVIYDAIERLEVGARSVTSNHLGEIDSLAHMDVGIFRPSFGHESWIATAQRRAERARKPSALARHSSTHDHGPISVWALVEVLDFADVSRLFAGLRGESQHAIAVAMGFDYDRRLLSPAAARRASRQHPFAGWLHSFSVLRNTVAHHGRTWNQKFVPTSTTAARTIPALSGLCVGQSTSLYAILSVMAYLLETISPGSTWAHQVRELIENELEPIAHRSASEMGFPRGWKQAPVWRQR